MRAVLILTAALLTGCASKPTWLENRVACTLDRKEAHFLSKWGLVSVGSEIAAADAKVICK